MGNAVVHFELDGPNPEAAAKFYSELFGWHTQAVPGETPYILIDTHAGGGINGGMGKSQGGQAAVVFYVEGPDIAGLLAKAESLGAKVVVPVTVVPDMVTFATFLDPQGNLVGLVLSGQGEAPGVSPGDNPAVSWFELQCADPPAAWDFYSDLFGWEIKRSQGEGPAYGEVESGAGGISGGIGASPDGQPHANLYAQVDDLHKYLERAESLGAKAILKPMDVGEGTSIAMFLDPHGTWFGLYRTSH